MTQRDEITTQPINRALLGKRMLLGAGIGLILMIIFLLGIREPNPAWGKLWMIRPLIVISLAGATGGACFHIMHHLSYRGGWRRILAYIMSLLVYIIGLWLGSVLGLVGTLWN